MFRGENVPSEDARRLLPVLESLALALRGQAKKDATDALEIAHALRDKGLKGAFVEDDLEGATRYLEGNEIDGRIPGEMSRNFTFLAHACSCGARRIATRLLEPGADPARAARGLASSTSETGLALLLEIATLEPSALQLALDAAVLSPYTERLAQTNAIAARLPSIDVSRVVAHEVPLLVTLARLGLLSILEGKPEFARISDALDASVVARLRTSNLALGEGARVADVVPAARMAIQQYLREARRTGSPTLEDLERAERLEACERWLRKNNLL